MSMNCGKSSWRSKPAWPCYEAEYAAELVAQTNIEPGKSWHHTNPASCLTEPVRETLMPMASC